MTKAERLAHIERELNQRNGCGGTDKDWMLAVIREQAKALAEARVAVCWLLPTLSITKHMIKAGQGEISGLRLIEKGIESVLASVNGDAK